MDKKKSFFNKEETDGADDPAVKSANLSPDRKTSGKSAAKAVTAKSMWPGILKIKDTPSGAEYVFPNAGAELPIDPLDVEFMKEKGQDQGGCCGSVKQRKKYFEILED